jgi:hypothetical protein
MGNMLFELVLARLQPRPFFRSKTCWFHFAGALMSQTSSVS